MKTCDLAIIDFHMPGFSGDAVTASLRSASSQRDKPCALYLYTTDLAATQKYASLGFDGYFSDKGDEASLVRQVQSAFRLLNIRAMSRKVLAG
jgi:DNA-binding NarL/FixJ family response regulator